MKIALINISIRPDAKKKILPVGLGFIATAMKNAEIKFDIIDMDINNYTVEDVEKIIEKEHYDVFLFGCIVSGFKYAKELSESIRKVTPQATIIAGNSFADAIPDLALRKTEVDICVLGEGDDTVPELLKALNSGSSLHEVKGIVFLEEGQLVKTPPRPYRDSMDSYGFPDWDLFELEKYKEYFHMASLFSKDKEICSFPLNSARGCPHSCTFCYIVVRNKKIRYRRYSEEAIYNEILRLHEKYGANHIDFWDDYSFPNKTKLIERLETIERLPFKIKWSGIIRTGLLKKDDKDIIRRAAESGCTCLAFSLESASEEILKAINKNIEVDDFLEQCHVLYDNGIPPATSIILGYPQETLETMKKTIDVCKKSRVYPSVGFLLPLPGTEVYQWCKDSKKISSDFDFLMNIGDRQDFHINLTSIPDDIFLESAEKGFRELAEEFGLELESVFKTTTYQETKNIQK